MKLLDHRITLPTYDTPLTIIPFGCIHADDPGFREHLWQQCVNEIVTTPHCLAIGLGDYKNLFRTHARMHLKSYVADEDSWRELDAIIRGEARKFAEKWLAPMGKKLIGLAEGNHYYRFMDGTTDTQYMCQLLHVPYLEKPAFIRLGVQFGGWNRCFILKLILHHGDWSAGYSRAGGDLNSIELKGMAFDFDIYIFSHTHRKLGHLSPSLTIPTKGKLKPMEKPRIFIRTGCFVATYDECTQTYGQKRLLPPTELGYIVATVRWSRHRDKEEYAQMRRDGKSYRERVNAAKENLKHAFSVRL